MDRKHNPALVENARELRKNMTPQERHLWYDFLRGYELRFARQKIIGKYIVDFYCAKARLAVELDGSQHYEDAARRIDEQRDEYLARFGIRVLRFSNNDINKHFYEVCTQIDDVVKQRIKDE